MNDPRRVPPRRPAVQPSVARQVEARLDVKPEQLLELLCAVEAELALTLLSLLYVDPEDEVGDEGGGEAGEGP